MPRTVFAISVLLAALCAASPAAPHDPGGAPPAVAGEVETITAYLKSHPGMAQDFRGVSGEFCFNTWKAGGHMMTHFAVDPAATQEDVIDFVRAGPLLEGKINVQDLPPLPARLGAMKPGQWYYLKAGAFDPHHGRKFPFPLIVRASNLD